MLKPPNRNLFERLGVSLWSNSPDNNKKDKNLIYELKIFSLP